MPATPATVLGAMPMTQGASLKPAFPAEKTSNDVARISGSEGHYVAYFKSGDGQPKPFKVGDRLPNGGAIRWITSTQVG